MLAIGCTSRSTEPVSVSQLRFPALPCASLRFPAHQQDIRVKEFGYNAESALAVFSKATSSPAADLPAFVRDAQRYGREWGAYECIVQIRKDPNGEFALVGWLQVEFWKTIPGHLRPGSSLDIDRQLGLAGR